MSIDANGVVTNGMLARYDAGIKDIIAMRTAEKNPVRYKVVKSTSTGSQTYSFYKKDENDTEFVVDSASDAITVQDSIDSTSKDPVNGAAVAAEFATQMTTQNINSIIGYTPMDSSIKGAANGVASLDGLGQVPTSQLPLVDTYSATGTKPVTGTAVAAALATLPEPMVFIGTVGTGGTVTSLPTAANSNKGHTYKAISDNIVSGSKIGDTFISTGSAWVTIPSGDEPSGTVTQVGINASSGSHLSASGTVTSSGTLTVGVESGYQIPTSSDVSQISTNKSNILYTLNRTGKNCMDLQNPYRVSALQGQETYTNGDNGSVTITDTNTIWSTYQVIGYVKPNTAYKLVTYVSNFSSSVSLFVKESLTSETNLVQGSIQDNGTITTDITTGSSNQIRICYNLNNSATAKSNSITLRAMLVETTTYNIDSTYVPASLPNYDLTRLEAEDRAALAQEIDAGAKNKLLIDLAYIQSINTAGAWNNNVYTINNVTIAVNSNKTITLNGTSNGAFEFQLMSRISGNFKLDTGNYTFNNSLTTSTGGNWDIAVNRTVSGSGVRYGSDTGSGLEFTVTDSSATTGVWIACNVSGAVFNNVTIKPMICTKAAFGVSNKFVPYRPNWDLVESAVSALNSTVFSPVYSANLAGGGTACTDIIGGYIRIGNLVVVNIRCSAATAIPVNTNMIVGLPRPLLSQSVTVTCVYNNLNYFISLLGTGEDARISNGSTGAIESGTTLILSCIYIAG